MQDLLQSQIIESCNLALPEGLKDLMSDISREVLRAQPKDILGFITNYLSCLLVTRENMAVACQVYDTIRGGVCSEGLEEDLRKLEIYEDDIVTIMKMVEKYFKDASAGKTVNESTLVSNLINRTSIVIDQVPAIQEAIRKAYMQTRVDDFIDVDEPPQEYDDISEGTRAVHHTLKLFKQSQPTEAEYERAAIRIQAAYRAYGVRRDRNKKPSYVWTYVSSPANKSPSFRSAQRLTLNSEEVKGRDVFSADPKRNSSFNQQIGTTLNYEIFEEIPDKGKECKNSDEETVSSESQDDLEEIREREISVKFNHDPKFIRLAGELCVEYKEEDEKHDLNEDNELEDKETMNVEFDNIPEVIAVPVENARHREEVEGILEKYDDAKEDSFLNLIS